MTSRDGSAGRIPSPIGTGGGGERFEQRVGAYALALLLARSTAPILLDSVIIEVHLQARQLGWRTDDVLIIADRHPGEVRKLAIQAKRRFTVSSSDEDCAKTISGMWDDFSSAERFNPLRDRLAVATLQGTGTLLHDFASLLDCARAANSGADFRRRLELSGYLSQKAKDQHTALVDILTEHLGRAPDADTFWRFLRVVCVLSLDLGTPTSQTDAVVLSLLAHLAIGDGDPRFLAAATWKDLLDLAGEDRASAGSLRRDDLPQALRERHQAVPTADERARLALIAHGQMVRRAIRTQLANAVVIDRTPLAERLRKAIEGTRGVLVSGAAGSGKSAVVKALLDRLEDERPVLAFQAVEFATAHLNETLARAGGRLDATILGALLAAHDRTTIFVDGVERLLEHPVRDAFVHLLQFVASRPSLQLIVTCRDYSTDTVRSALLEPADLSHQIIDVVPLTDVELNDVAHQMPALQPLLGERRMRAFLRTPYLLSMAARIDWASGTFPETIRAFRERCWRDVVRDEAHRADGMPQRRDDAFVSVARRRASELKPYVESGVDDPYALEALYAASLLDRSPASDRLYAPAHDVLEDWALLRVFDHVGGAGGDVPAVLSATVAGLPAMRRALRLWLGERLEVDPAGAGTLVLDVVGRQDLPAYFRDDCVVAALLSDAALAFVDGCRRRVDDGDLDLLRQVVHMLRVGCKTLPWWLSSGGVPSSLLVPTGPAWSPVLALVADHPPTEAGADAMLALGLVEDWARQLSAVNGRPEGAAAAGTLASALLPLVEHGWHNEVRERVLKLVVSLPIDAPAFADMARRALEGDDDDRVTEEFGDLVMSVMSCVHACRETPDFVIALLRSRLLLNDADIQRHLGGWSRPLDVDECFGMRRMGHDQFFPTSAYQGPIRLLFNHHPRAALELVIELANHAGDWYGTQRWPGNDLESAEQITLDVPGYGQVQQWFVGRLYAAYRGVTVVPHALTCALMALEDWLLSIAKSEHVDLEVLLCELLGRGNSALTTGVVASLCAAQPVRSGRAALCLISSLDVMEYDRHRKGAEANASFEFLSGINPAHLFFENERRASNKLPHRQKELETVALELQVTARRAEVWAIIDHQRELLGGGAPGETKMQRLALHRMDLRGYRYAEAPASQAPIDSISLPDDDRSSDVVSTEGGADGAVAGTVDVESIGAEPPAVVRPDSSQTVAYIEPGMLEPDLAETVANARRDLADMNRDAGLTVAAQKAWDEPGGAEAARWRELLQEARALAEREEQVPYYHRGASGVVAAVCLRDHLGDMEEQDQAWCIGRVARTLREAADAGGDGPFRTGVFDADKPSAAVAALVVAKAPALTSGPPSDLLVMALTHPSADVVDHAYAGARLYLDGENRELRWRLIAAAIAEAGAWKAIHAAENDWHSIDEPRPKVDRHALLEQGVRAGLAASMEDAKTALSSLTLDSWADRRAAARVWTILVAQPNDDESLDFVARVARWLAEAWRRKPSGQNRQDRDHEAEYGFSRRLARSLLMLPSAVAVAVCEPIIALTGESTDKVATFLEHLTTAADGGADDSFWALWQAIADRALAASWVKYLGRERPFEETFVKRLFLRAQWKESTKHWARVEGHAHRVHALAERLPAVVVVAEAYLEFLYTIGRQELPGAFLVVHSILMRAEDRGAMLTKEASFLLESLLAEFVYGRPALLKGDPRLSAAVLELLDVLVAGGSSAAYRMRDDFVTPLR